MENRRGQKGWKRNLEKLRNEGAKKTEDEWNLGRNEDIMNQEGFNKGKKDEIQREAKENREEKRSK